jgi:hypothetical protein
MWLHKVCEATWGVGFLSLHNHIDANHIKKKEVETINLQSPVSIIFFDSRPKQTEKCKDICSTCQNIL